MYDTSKTTAMFTAAKSGMQSALQYLYQNNSSSVTQSSLTQTTYNNTSGVNSAFFQMLNSSFTSYDTDGDGTLTSTEANQALTSLSSGLTQSQISQLQSQGLIDSDLANKVIANFSKIDQNGDGKVTEAEINAYCMDEDIQAKKDDQTNLLLKNMSTFYDVDVDTTSSSSTTTSSSSTSSTKKSSLSS